MAKIKDKLQEAFHNNPLLFATKETIDVHKGTTVEELAAYGLEKRDLKRLETMGLAVRGYRRVRVGAQEYTELRWILINRGMLENGKVLEK